MVPNGPRAARADDAAEDIDDAEGAILDDEKYDGDSIVPVGCENRVGIPVVSAVR